jgi:hypothetical protein
MGTPTMRPDRFGQSRAGEFIESQGREREHAFVGPVMSTASCIVDIGGFLGFEPYTNPFTNPPFPDGLGTIEAYGHWSPLPRLYRKINARESYSALWTGNAVERESVWEFTGVSVRPGTPATVSQQLIGPDPPAFAGGSLYLATQTDTSRTIQMPGGDIVGNQVVSKVINYGPWVEMLKRKFALINEFPSRHRLQLKAGFVQADEKENPTVEDDENYEMVPTTGGGATSFSAFQMSRSATVDNLSGLTPGPADIRVNVVWGGLRIEMYKVLIGTIGPGGVPYTSFKDWVVGVAIPLDAYEISCGVSPPTEVLEAPDVDGSLIGFQTRAAIFFRRFAFPPSPQPGTALVGNLVPSCAPFWV